MLISALFTKKNVINYKNPPERAFIIRHEFNFVKCLIIQNKKTAGNFLPLKTMTRSLLKELFDQDHFPGLAELIRFESVEVHAAWIIRCIPVNLIAANSHVLIQQFRYFPAECIED